MVCARAILALVALGSFYGCFQDSQEPQTAAGDDQEMASEEDLGLVSPVGIRFIFELDKSKFAADATMQIAVYNHQDLAVARRHLSQTSHEQSNTDLSLGSVDAEEFRVNLPASATVSSVAIDSLRVVQARPFKVEISGLNVDGCSLNKLEFEGFLRKGRSVFKGEPGQSITAFFENKTMRLANLQWKTEPVFCDDGSSEDGAELSLEGSWQNPEIELILNFDPGLFRADGSLTLELKNQHKKIKKHSKKISEIGNVWFLKTRHLREGERYSIYLYAPAAEGCAISDASWGGTVEGQVIDIFDLPWKTRPDECD